MGVPRGLYDRVEQTADFIADYLVARDRLSTRLGWTITFLGRSFKLGMIKLLIGRGFLPMAGMV